MTTYNDHLIKPNNRVFTQLLQQKNRTCFRLHVQQNIALITDLQVDWISNRPFLRFCYKHVSHKLQEQKNNGCMKHTPGLKYSKRATEQKQRQKQQDVNVSNMWI